MSFSRFRTWLLAASATTVLYPIAPASAAEGAADAAAADAETTSQAAAPNSAAAILVTANRREQDLQDVASAVSVLDDATFTVGGVGRSANEVLDLVPNASAGTQQHGRPRWWIRGVGAGQQQLDLANPVGFYLDDIYISNASATGLPLFDIERVEVLRGPQGTLWGKNTTGGAINVVTRKPSLSPRDGDSYAKVDYGSFNALQVQTGINVVLAEDAVAARISGYIEDRDGRFTNRFTDRNSNGVEDAVVRSQILVRASDDLKVLAGFHYRKYKTDGAYWTTVSYSPDGVFRNGYEPPRDRDFVNYNAPEQADVEQFGGYLKFDWNIGATTLTSITGAEVFDKVETSDGDFTPLEISRTYSDARSEQWSQELRFASDDTARFQWIVGLYYFNETIRSLDAGATLPEDAVPALPGDTEGNNYSRATYDHRAESGAVFANAGYDITDTLNLNAGARFTRETKKLDYQRLASPDPASASWSNLARWWDSYTGSFGGAGTFSDNLKETWDAFTFDVTPSWQVAPDHLLYFKFSHGLKSGGFNTAAKLPVALQVVKPEKLDSYELGYKSNWLDGDLTVNATLFHYQYDDIQVNVVGPNPGAVGGATTSYLQNAEEGHVDGAELEVVAKPLAGLQLNAALGLLDTKYDKLQVVNGGADLSGAQFVRSPHVTLNAGAVYTIDLTGGGFVELAADARYQSLQHYFITPQDLVNRYLLSQPAYTVANGRISYITPDERFTFSAYVKNAFNEVYRNHALPQARPGITGDTVTWAEPRTWGVSLLANF
ncbi:MAG: TonB-dependent receptor [Novosphingobium sp.]